jgi:hypothetical protein
MHLLPRCGASTTVGQARGLVVDIGGVMLGPNCVLVERVRGGYRRIDAAALDQLLKTTFGDAHPLRRLSTPALRKSQAEIRKQFMPMERKQYVKLRRLQPQCITFTDEELKELERPPKSQRAGH